MSETFLAGVEEALFPEVATRKSVRVTLPLRIDSMANVRMHHMVRARAVKSHRMAMMAVPAFPLPCAVRLVRIAPRMLDDDNWQAAAKGLRDGIADRLGVKDNDRRVVWEYAQERGVPKYYGVRIELEAR